MKYYFLMVLLAAVMVSRAQTATVYRVAFYNVENLYDIYDDPEKNDDEFLPHGIKGWNYTRYYQKLRHLYKTIAAFGEGSHLVAFGMCELENNFVTRQLLENTPLKKCGYRFIQYESPDRRGVDVALAYDPKVLTPLFSEPITIRFPFDTLGKTRDILYVKVLLTAVDTLHLFVNHWPSRFGGLTATIPKRNFVASVLKQRCDSLFRISPQAAIIIMGDLNDDPTDESVLISLGADNHSLINLMHPDNLKEKGGTLKHESVWNVFDQIIVSPALLQGHIKTSVLGGCAHIAALPFLLCEDPKWPGTKLYRTYSGMQYLGGFADHLPVYIDLKVRTHNRDVN
ncbi:MAG: endonuclease [Bacteroidia bacterium]|nr:endonuclease [Bacteroidia bacterium]